MTDSYYAEKSSPRHIFAHALDYAFLMPLYVKLAPKKLILFKNQ